MKLDYRPAYEHSIILKSSLLRRACMSVGDDQIKHIQVKKENIFKYKSNVLIMDYNHVVFVFLLQS